MFENCFTYTTLLTRFKGNIKAFSGMCPYVNNFISTDKAECVDFSDLSGATVGWLISYI